MDFHFPRENKKLKEPMTKPHKTKNCLIRLSESDHTVLDAKAALLGTDKSKLFRNAAFQYWNGAPSSDKSAEKLLTLYQDGDDKQKTIIVEMIFQFLRRHGYPHNELSRDQLIRGMFRIANTKNPLLEDNHLQTNTTGLDVANYFHPHMVKVRCLTGYSSPHELFMNDDGLRDAINRWMELGKKPTMSGLRRILRTRDKTRSVVNFKPAIAKYFYDNYVPRDGGVLDMCMGFGGRLAGCIASNRGLFYHGIDPDGATAIGNMRMAAFYHEQYDNDIERERTWNFRFKLDLGCAEDIMPILPSESYHLLFTSPPFFQVEKYSSNPNQSYLRYPEYPIWRDKFLFVLIRESFRLCKANGYLVLNLKDYKAEPIATDGLGFAQKIGFKLVCTYQQRLNNSEYHRRAGEPTWHSEPIFVLVKEIDADPVQEWLMGI